MQYHAIPCNTMQYHAIPCNTMQYHAIPCNTMQYYAIPCNTMQYPASLITADGAYHCPVGSIMAIFIVPLTDLYHFSKGGTRVWRIRAFAALCVITILPLAVLTIVTLVKVLRDLTLFLSAVIFQTGGSSRGKWGAVGKWHESEVWEIGGENDPQGSLFDKLTALNLQLFCISG